MAYNLYQGDPNDQMGKAAKRRAAALLRRLRDPEKYREKSRLDSAKQRARHPEKIRQAVEASRIKRQYGISIEQYNEMFDAQGGVCAICEKPQYGRFTKLCIDHDHNNGKLRGLLCTACNFLVGQLEKQLRPAADNYIAEWKLRHGI